MWFKDSLKLKVDLFLKSRVILSCIFIFFFCIDYAGVIYFFIIIIYMNYIIRNFNIDMNYSIDILIMF